MAIDPYIFELIRSRDVEERKKGVKALARTEDREALRYLATIYKEDSDPEVRDLALKAGQHIKKRTELANWGDDMGAAAGRYEDVEVKRESPKPKSSLPNDAKTTEAKKLMDKAMDLVMQADYAQAQDNAYDAFALAPHLASDPYYAGMAAEILGMPMQQALVALKEGRPDYEVGGGKKRKRGAGNNAEGSWTEFLIDSAIYFIVVAASFTFFMVITFNQLATSDALNNISTSSREAYQMAQSLNELSSVGFIPALSSGIGAGIGGLISIWIQLFVIHLVATMMLGGAGSFRRLLHNSLMQMILQVVVSIVLAGALIYFSLPTVAQLALNPNSTPTEGVGMLNILNGINILSGLIFTLWFSYIIGQNYDMGMGKGCGSIIISGILFMILACCFYFALIQMVSSAFTAMPMALFALP